MQTLSAGLAEQVKKERARLEMEIKHVADKALHSVQNWYVCKLSKYAKKNKRSGNLFSLQIYLMIIFWLSLLVYKTLEKKETDFKYLVLCETV